MIKGLYFKLDTTNEKHNYIRNFFNRMKARHINKVDCLYYLCRIEAAAENVVKVKRGQEETVIEKYNELLNESASWGPLIADINDNSKEEKNK